MRVNDRVEPLVRSVLDAAVAREADRFEAALGAFPDDQAAREGITLALAIIGTVLIDLYENAPSGDRLDGLATEISQQETWMQPNASEVRTLLGAVVDGTALAEVIPAESIVILAYLVAANLLASSSRPGEGEWWFNYLDKVEAAIEAA